MPVYLLDADTLIKANNLYYPMDRFPPFWRWLLDHAEAGIIRIPTEQFEEITAGTDQLSQWLKQSDVKDKLLLPDEVDGDLIQRVTLDGYGDLNEVEIEKVGRDPFLIAHALSELDERVVVTFENSRPGKKRQNRKVPDVCDHFGIKHTNLFELIAVLDFNTNWGNAP